MEGLQNTVPNAMSVSQDPVPNLSSTVNSIASTFEKAKASFKNFSSDSSSNSIPTQPPPPLLLTRQPRNVVSLSACSKLCAVCFVAGVLLGYTLKQRVRRWASKLLRRLKDE